MNTSYHYLEGISPPTVLNRSPKSFFLLHLKPSITCHELSYESNHLKYTRRGDWKHKASIKSRSVPLFSISLTLRLETAALGAGNKQKKEQNRTGKPGCRFKLPSQIGSAVLPSPAVWFENLGLRWGLHPFSTESWALECLWPHSSALKYHPPLQSDSQDLVGWRGEAGRRSLPKETTGNRFLQLEAIF